MGSETEIPINTIDVITCKDSEKDVNSKLEVKCPETDDNTIQETQTAQNGEATQNSEEEEKKENIEETVNDKIEDKKGRQENNLSENPGLDISEDQNEKPVENGIFDDDTASKNLELLWAEAIKAQNEGRYKDAIRNFTAIYENKHSTPEIKHKTKCRLVFALYQDNQADEAEKIGWESEIVPANVNKNEGSVDDASKLKSGEANQSITDPKIHSGEEQSKPEFAEEVLTSVDVIKPPTPTSPVDDNESTITRISECSDDSNLIKLDLSQLVGEPVTNSDANKELANVKNEKIAEGEVSSDNVVASEDSNEAIVIDVRNDESEVTVRITSIPTPVSELEATKTTMAVTDASQTKKKEKKKKKSAKTEASTSKAISQQIGDSNLNCLHCNV